MDTRAAGRSGNGIGPASVPLRREQRRASSPKLVMSPSDPFLVASRAEADEDKKRWDERLKKMAKKASSKPD